MIKKFGVALVSIIAASSIFYFLTVLGLKSITTERVWNRESGGLVDLVKAQEKMSDILALCQNDLNIILGSSVSKYLVVNKSITQVNLSYAGPAPGVQKLFLKELSAILKNCGPHKVKVYIEYLPYLYTEKGKESFHYKNQLKLSYLMNWSELTHDLLQGQTGTWEIMSYKARLNTASEMMGHILYSHLPGTTKVQTMEESIKMYDELSDLKSLGFSEQSLNEFVDQVELLIFVSSSVTVYYPPKNPAWSFSSEGSTHLQKSLEVIEMKTGLTIKTFKAEYLTSDFWDAVHPTKSGVEKMEGEFL